MSPWIKFVITVTLFLEIHIHAQDVLTVITKSKYECGSSLKLRCAPPGCCSGPINWNKDATQIMTGGVSNLGGKYRQETVPGSHFDFTIDDLEDTDFSGTYACSFVGDTSNRVTLNSADLYCPPCGTCGGICFAFSLVVVVIAVVMAIVVPMRSDLLKEKAKMITAVSIGIGLVLDIVVSVTVGIKTCMCEHGYGPACLSLGVVAIVAVLTVILIIYLVLKHQKGQTRSHYRYRNPSAEASRSQYHTSQNL